MKTQEKSQYINVYDLVIAYKPAIVSVGSRRKNAGNWMEFPLNVNKNLG